MWPFGEQSVQQKPCLGKTSLVYTSHCDFQLPGPSLVQDQPALYQSTWILLHLHGEKILAAKPGGTWPKFRGRLALENSHKFTHPLESLCKSSLVPTIESSQVFPNIISLATTDGIIASPGWGVKDQKWHGLRDGVSNIWRHPEEWRLKSMKINWNLRKRQEMRDTNKLGEIF